MIECDDPNCEQRFDDSQWYADEDDLLAAAKDEGWQIPYKDEHPELERDMHYCPAHRLPECKQAQFAGIPWFQPRECQVDDTTERYTVRCDCGGSMPGRYVPIDPSFQTRVTCLHSAVEKWNRRG